MNKEWKINQVSGNFLPCFAGSGLPLENCQLKIAGLEISQSFVIRPGETDTRAVVSYSATDNIFYIRKHSKSQPPKKIELNAGKYLLEFFSNDCLPQKIEFEIKQNTSQKMEMNLVNA